MPTQVRGHAHFCLEVRILVSQPADLLCQQTSPTVLQITLWRPSPPRELPPVLHLKVEQAVADLHGIETTGGDCRQASGRRRNTR